MPDTYYRNTVVGSPTLLESMFKHRIHRIVSSAICLTHGDPPSFPISEEHIQNPVNPNGQSELTFEKMLRDFETAYGLKSVLLRYFKAAGADPEG
jgi:UDP-glucose 4-epimerase